MNQQLVPEILDDTARGEGGRFARGKHLSSLPSYLVRGVLGVGAFKGISIVTGAVTSILIARTLGPEGYGQLAFVLAILNLVVLPVNGGMAPLLVREVAKSTGRRDWPHLKQIIRSANRWTIHAALIAVVLVITAAYWFAQDEADTRMRLLAIGALAIPLWAFLSVRTGILQGLGKVVLAQFADWILCPTVQLALLGIMWLYATLTPVNVLVINLIAIAVGLTFASLTVRVALPSEIQSAAVEQDTSSWLRALWPFLLLQLVSVANAQIVIALLGTFGSDTQTGLYRVADNAASLVSVSLIIVNAVIAPQITHLYQAGDVQRLERLAQGSARAALALALPAVLCFVLGGQWLLGLLFGTAYVEAYVTLLILLAGQFVNVACGSVGLLLNMTGYEKDSLQGLSFALAINVVLCILLIPRYGERGAAVATASGMMLWNGWLLLRVRQRLGIRCAVV